MIVASTKIQKKSLAHALGEHDSEALVVIVQLADRFGPFEAVAYEADDFERHRLVVKTALKEKLKGE